MNDIVPIKNITGMIHLVRGQKVMLDRDLAELYDVDDPKSIAVAVAGLRDPALRTESSESSFRPWSS